MERRHLNWYMIFFNEQTQLNENKIHENINKIRKYDNTLNVLNKGSQHTGYGNIAHVIVEKLIEKTDKEDLFMYTRLLYILVNIIDCIDLHKRNKWKLKPIDTFHFAYDNNVQYLIYKKAYIYHNKYKKIIEYILEDKLVIKQQAYIRRYLANKKVHRLRLQKCLDLITYAPPGQIEFCNSYANFKGGIHYLQIESVLY